MQNSWHSAGLEKLRSFCYDTLAPAPDLRVYEWLENNCYVRGEHEGQYSTLLTPYVREPLDCFADKRVEDLTLCFGTQTAKTTIVMGGVAYRIALDPMDCLWVMPDKELGGSFSRNRWIPWVDDCGPVADLKPSDRKLFSTREQKFARMTVYFVGSNSPAQLASRPCGLVVMDETDKFGIRSDREAGALRNAEERTKTFNFPLRVKTSTPTVYYGEIWQQFLMGDQRYYWVPCPRCGEFIRLLWANVRWWRKDEAEAKTDGDWDMAKVRQNTHYVCQNCSGEILNAEKTAMLQRGEWRPSNPQAEASRRSYHLNSLYAPWKQTAWGQMAVKWLQAKATIDGRQNFINSTLAEVWDGENAYDDEPIPASAYVPAEISRDRLPLMTVDVQENHFWAVVRVWAKTAESWLQEAGRFDTVEELEALQRKWGVHPHNVVLDVADQTPLVCKWLVDHDWRGAWGSPKNGFVHNLVNGYRVQKLVSQVQMRDPHLGTVNQSERNPRAKFIYWANDPIKDILAIRRHADNPRTWHIHGDIPQEYIRHMNAEMKVVQVNPSTGRTKQIWKRVRKANHLFDCEAMQIVAALMAGVIQEDHEKYANAQGALKLANSAAN